MSPLNLSDDELDQILAASMPLDRDRRAPFVEAVTAELATCPLLGPGVVHRAIVNQQRHFYDPPTFSSQVHAPRPKYGR